MSTCALCRKRIRDGLLMCSADWRRVSGPTQQRVYRTWAVLSRTSISDPKAWRAALDNYDQAKRDAVREAGSTTTRSAVVADLARIVQRGDRP